MLGIKYFRADSSTFVIKTINGKIRKQGKGLSFFYNSATSSIAIIPINAQQAPFIFNLQTMDFQEVKVQGQITYRIVAPQKTAALVNFNLKKGSMDYVSEDPLKLSDSVISAVQTIIQCKLQEETLHNALRLNQTLIQLIKQEIAKHTTLEALGIHILDVTLQAISPTPETARALEAQAREAILKQADDAIYLRRKSAVEQELTIKEAELQTALTVQQKEQEIKESQLQNERAILRKKAETEQERLNSKIEAEQQRKALVVLNADNSKQESDMEAYAISAKVNAFKQLPVDYVKAMALANMQSEQLMAMAFESLAQNASKIGELNINPDLFGQVLKKAVN